MKRGPAQINHKQEALKALDEVILMLSAVSQGKTLTPLDWMKLGATAGFARVQVEQIQELKKQRKTQPAASPQGSLNT